MSESYSAQIKTALCEKTAQSFGFLASEQVAADDCCKLAFFSALLLFGCQVKDDRVCFSVRHDALADLFVSAAAAFYSLSPSVEHDKISLVRDAAFARVLRAADLSLEKDTLNAFPLSVCAECQGYFLRGVFLCCGTMTDPKKARQLNLFSDEKSAPLAALMQESGLNFRRCSRRGHDYLYLKKATDIEDFLARIGAQTYAMELINSEIERSMRANINRQNNFDTANISRSSLFLSRLGDAIEDLEARGATEQLPEGLKTLVRLRRAYPDETLSELGERIHPPLSKSGLYHRAKKLIDLANKKEF